ncbi:hypothetical protein S83_033293 [Arachis hypogaea]
MFYHGSLSVGKFDVALLVPLLALVLSLQHILFPISRPFKDNFATLKETEFAVNTLQRAELQNILSNNGIGIGNLNDLHEFWDKLQIRALIQGFKPSLTFYSLTA